MPSTQPFGISCKGGLNTNLNEFEILAAPGSAVQLTNYEVDPDGGYRRINGYTPYGDIRDDVTPADVKVKGLQVYADGVIITGNNKVVFSFKDSNGTVQYIPIDNSTSGNTLSGANYLDATYTSHKIALNYSDQGQGNFTVYNDNVENGRVIICDGVNKPLLITITGSGAFSTRNIT